MWTRGSFAAGATATHAVVLLALTGIATALGISACDEGGVAQGKVTYRALYTPCGQSLKENSHPVDYTFTGQEIDIALASQDFGARTYFPSFCQFASGDPIDPSGTSAYAYPHNNPLRFVDPSGATGEKAQGEWIQLNGQWWTCPDSVDG